MVCMHIFGFREKILITALQLFVNLRAWYTLNQVVPCNLLAPIEHGVSAPAMPRP